MPYVNIRITDEGATAAQKATLIRGVTDLLVEVLDKDPETTHVVIDEVPLDNWGVAGLPTPAYRHHQATNDTPNTSSTPTQPAGRDTRHPRT